MPGYFHQTSADEPPERTTYEVNADLLDVMASNAIPKRLRPLARGLGAGSALSSPHLLLRDLVNLYDSPEVRRNVAGPATAALLGGSVSTEGQLDATGIAFSVSGGIVGFVTFAIPAALLVPGGGFYVAYRLYRLMRDTASLHRYARVSRAAPHVATAIVVSDAEVTRDEARLLRDLVRGRVGSPKERHDLLELELDPLAKQEAAFAALREIPLEPGDWPALLSIAIATAHADDHYSGEEQELIEAFRAFTTFSTAEFANLAAEAEADYRRRCHLGQAMVRACYQIACAGEAELPADAALLIDIVICAAVPSDFERSSLTRELKARRGPTAMSRDELTRGASEQAPGLFRRVAGARSESAERVRDFGRTMALFLATLEQWRGWVVRECRQQLVAIGGTYGLGEKQLLKWVREAHHNTEELRHEWIAPRPWEVTDEQELDVVVQHLADADDVYGVTGLAGGHFLFMQGDTSWEWKSSSTNFDVFVRTTLSLQVTEVSVHTDETTFELLTVTIEAHDSMIRVQRAQRKERG